MGRTIRQIQASIVAAKEADAVVGIGGSDELSSTSNVALWLLWTWICATAMWVNENLFDAHKAEVAAIIATQKPHTTKWYVTKAKAYQYGDALPEGSDTYAVIDTDVQIVANAAAIEGFPFLRIKAAKLVGGVLAALSGGELTGLTAYVNRIKDAGVPLKVTSGDGDSFRLALAVYYDALILDSAGARLDGTSATPVQDAVNAFLDNLPFNGLFVLNELIVALRAVDGVRITRVAYCAAQYGALAYAPIIYEYTPDAGYMVLDSAYFIANTTYVAHGPI